MCVAAWPCGPSDKHVCTYRFYLAKKHTCRASSWQTCTHLQHSHIPLISRLLKTPAFHLLFISGFMVNLKFMFDCANACLTVFGLRLEMEFSDRWVYVSITPLFQIKMMMSPPAPHHLHLQQVGSHEDPSSSNHCCSLLMLLLWTCQCSSVIKQAKGCAKNWYLQLYSWNWQRNACMQKHMHLMFDSYKHLDPLYNI